MKEFLHLVFGKLTQKIRFVNVILLTALGFIYQCLNGELPSRKCSIMEWTCYVDAKPLIMSGWGSAFKEVNDFDPFQK